jgi:hypothetical protein
MLGGKFLIGVALCGTAGILRDKVAARDKAAAKRSDSKVPVRGYFFAIAVCSNGALLMPAGAGFDPDHQQAEMIDYAGVAGQIAAAFPGDSARDSNIHGSRACAVKHLRAASTPPLLCGTPANSRPI